MTFWCCDDFFLSSEDDLLQNSTIRLEVTNNDTSTVICGVRVEVGRQDVERAPSGVSIHGRPGPVRFGCFLLAFITKNICLDGLAFCCLLSLLWNSSWFFRVDEIDIFEIVLILGVLFKNWRFGPISAVFPKQPLIGNRRSGKGCLSSFFLLVFLIRLPTQHFIPEGLHTKKIISLGWIYSID